MRLLSSFRVALAVPPLAAALLLSELGAQPARQPIERAGQLPVHSYRVSMPPSRLLRDDTAFARLSTELRRDLETDLRDYDIRDRTTLKLYYGTLQTIAFLEERWDDGLAYIDRIRAIEDKPAARLLSGVTDRSYVASRRAPPAAAESTFAAAFRRELAALPYDSVQAQLKAQKGQLELLTPNLLLGLLEQQLDVAARSGSVSKDIAIALVGIRLALDHLLPLKPVIVRELSAVIDAHRTEKADIWTARQTTLSATDRLHPVAVAVWDVGTDPDLFPGRMWTNAREIPGNGKDDDRNGFVDDVHGIGWSWMGEKRVGPLRPLAMPPADVSRFRQYTKGFGDIQANVDSPEARELRRVMSELPKEQVKSLIEGLNFFGNYAHGTHVAGIAARGNPAIRLLVARMDFPWEMIPPAPTAIWADAQARVVRETIAYFRRAGVRVVNMSWGFSPAALERMLEQNAAGGNAEERRVVARRYFDTVSRAFRDAIAAAPGILFVAAAGNSNNDVRFDENIPSSYDLPNTVSAGAVDKGGDEASFTSFGKVDVYANGYEVESVLPGGDTQRWSGTSMAAPQVANLAAKLFALHPDLSAEQVKRLIIEGADEHGVGAGRRIRLLNEKASIRLAAERSRGMK